MQEIEVKILDVDVDSTVEKLKQLGAKKIFEADQEAELYDFDDKRISKEHKMLRLRKNGDKIELTFKERISKEKAKVMEEHEINVSDADTTIKILNGIGLKKKSQHKKHRISYRLGSTMFEFDTYPGIPTFLEIEAESIDKIKEFVEKLGFSMDQAKPWTGKDVKEFYKK